MGETMKRLVPIALVCFTAQLLGQGTSAPAARKATDDDYKKLLSTSKFDGLVTGVGGKSISVKVNDTLYQKLLQQYNGWPEPKKTIALKQLNAELQASNIGKEFEFEFTDKVALRKLHLPTEYDERGNLKKYTSAELAKMKGNLVGYQAKSEDFTPGMPVSVYLTRVKGSNRPQAKMVVVDNTSALLGN
jgi:hypothetical protein